MLFLGVRAVASTGDAAVGGKRKANVLTNEELAANVRDGVRQATKDKYATAEPVFALDAFEQRCASTVQDTLMCVYLTNLVRSQTALAEKINACPGAQGGLATSAAGI